MDNTLNVSELLKRLGVVGDSQASASILDHLRLGLQIADLSQLVPPLRGPIAAASQDITSGISSFNKWDLHARSQGGLQIIGASVSPTTNAEVLVWISETKEIGASTDIVAEQFAFGQVADSVMSFADPPTVNAAPASAVHVNAISFERFVRGVWLGPGQFLNFQNVFNNNTRALALSWMEYTGALNP